MIRENNLMIAGNENIYSWVSRHDKKKIREKALQQTFFQYKNFFPFDSLITRIYPSMRDVTVEFQNE